jgi:hypothetical protein
MGERRFEEDDFRVEFNSVLGYLYIKFTIFIFKKYKDFY